MTKTPNIRLIPLSRGKFAIVDGKWFEMLSQISWCATVNKTGKFYAVAATLRRQNNGHKGLEQLGRVIMDAAPNQLVDHKNLNTLDYREENLRLCSYAGNSQNRAKFHGKSSVYKGVTYHKKNKKWRAHIGFNGKNIYLGEYATEELAAKIRDEAVKKYHGDFGVINFAS